MWTSLVAVAGEDAGVSCVSGAGEESRGKMSNSPKTFVLSFGPGGSCDYKEKGAAGPAAASEAGTATATSATTSPPALPLAPAAAAAAGPIAAVSGFRALHHVKCRLVCSRKGGTGRREENLAYRHDAGISLAGARRGYASRPAPASGGARRCLSVLFFRCPRRLRRRREPGTGGEAPRRS